MTDAPRGVRGGHGGHVAVMTLNPGTPDAVELPGKVTGIPYKAGDVIEIRSGTAGGWGSPLERDPWAVWRDWQDEILDREEAEGTYGVVLEAVGPALEATAVLRTQLAEARKTAGAPA